MQFILSEKAKVFMYISNKT